MADLLNALVIIANFIIVPGLAYGSQLALGALGVTLVFGVLRFSNIAHGETMAAGAMFTMLFTWLLQSMGIGFGPLPTALLALPFGVAGADQALHAAPLAVVGLLMTGQAYLRVKGLQLSDAPSVVTMLYSEIAFCYALEILFLGGRPRPVQLAGTALIIAGAGITS